MTIDDILALTPKFWQMHNEPAAVLDGGAMTLLSIQYNLCAGTIARYSRRRPELVPLVEDLLQYRKQCVALCDAKMFCGVGTDHVDGSVASSC